ncbi:LysR substrate-binding domain-containing protein [Echinimonas agarilytica]|uniref:LysR substrate-binding domain-containing protein n=1 Tax=Echinimonas agarilytica TaxID=1215918 RepID=A0AA41W6G4_9GAMM|nr:LysR substrate-binding domain-containing protein [Echinimonas agarilytica]MCM2679393.1 LysR substrate-binding domain-containing protein [Echinimonas agarilytica]
MKITLRQAQIFVGIVDTGSISAASERIHISQAAASMALKAFEDGLGQALFERHRKRLNITDYGIWLLPKARQLLELSQSIEQGPNGQLTGALMLGVSQTIGEHVIGGFNAEFLSKHPRVSLQLEVMNSDDVCERILNHRAHIGLIEGVINAPGINVEPWITDDLVVVTAPENPILNCEKVSQKELLQQAWLVRESGSGTRMVLERALGEAFEKLDIAHQVNHPETLIELCIQGQGLLCVSRRAAQHSLHSGRLCEVDTDLKLIRTFYVVTRSGEAQSHISRVYCENLQLAVGENRSHSEFIAIPNRYLIKVHHKSFI